MIKYEEKRWSDQPDVVEEGKIVMSTRINDRVMEVRHADDGRYFLTIGNLFGSQTLVGRNVDDVLRAVGRAITVKSGEQAAIPPGMGMVR